MLRLEPRIEALASAVRRTTSRGERISIELTAQTLGITLRRADLGDFVLAATYDEVVVLNENRRWSAARMRFAFAHEVAHVLIRRERMPWVEPAREEWWADRFAHELVLPRRWLQRASYRQLRLLSDPAERMTLALHFAALRRAPALTRVGEAVACATCGGATFFARCPCRSYRRNSVARLALPPFRLPPPAPQNQQQLFTARAA